MRIALIASDTLPIPAVKGGAIQVLIDAIKGKLAQEHELTIFSIADPGLTDEERKDSIQYIRFPKKIFWPRVTDNLKQRPDQFTLIHLFNRPKYLPQIKEASPQSCIILSLHNEMLGTRLINENDAAAVINNSDRILTVSKYIAKTLMRRFEFAAPKIRIWYSGIDAKSLPTAWSPEGRRIREELRSRYGLKEKKVLLFVGRLSKKKGVHVLLKAFRMLAREMDELSLVVVGGRWHGLEGMNTYIRKLHKFSKPFQKRIIFTGFVTPDKLHSHYLMGDIFVCPSQWQEPLARVHYEAMAAGIPIITTARGGNTEVINHGANGLVIYNYQHPKSFANTIAKLLEHPEEALVMAKRARRDVEEKFSLQKVYQELISHYQEALRHRNNYQ
jgi:glycosyltransferase involved in cell wall biosynthesis